MQIKVFSTGDGYDIGVTEREEFRLHTDGTPVISADQHVYHCGSQFSLGRTIVDLQQAYPEYFENLKIVPNMQMHVIGKYVVDTDENGNIINQWAPCDI